jgi:hypothetical protein
MKGSGREEPGQAACNLLPAIGPAELPIQRRKAHASFRFHPMTWHYDAELYFQREGA